MIFRCKGCNGTGMVWRRLSHPWADDGEEHTTRHQPCEGTGWMEKLPGGEVVPCYRPIRWRINDD